MKNTGKDYLRLMLEHLSLLCFLLTSIHVFPDSQLSFNNITLKQGLTNNTINAIYKDTKGFIWLGTELGLNRFDGIHVDVYPEFQDDNISAICETDSVCLWIGCNTGLKVLNRKTGAVSEINLDQAAKVAVKMLAYQNSTLYICTDKGLFVKTPENITHTAIERDKKRVALLGIAFDEQNNCWLSTSGGLVCYNVKTGEEKVFVYSKTNEALNKFNCLNILGSTIYIGSENAGLLVFDKNRRTFQPYPNIGTNCIMTITHQNNQLYVGTNGGGLKIISLKDKTVKTIAHLSDNPQSISSNAVYSFLLEGNNYWVGTFFAGLSYSIAPQNMFRMYSLPDKLNTMGVNVRSFWMDDDSRKIIGTRDGFYYIDEKNNLFQQFSSENTPVLKSNIILKVYPWRDSFLIGTYTGGLYLFDPSTSGLSEFMDNSLFLNNSFYAVAADKQQRLWFGSLNGIIYYNPENKEVKHFTSANSNLISNAVYSICIDMKNRLWIGSAEGVCVCDIETGKIKTDVLPETLSPHLKMIRYIYEDKLGNIWLCSDSYGPICYNPNNESYQHFSIQNILPDALAISVIEDNLGYIWISTPKGLVRYDNKTGDYSIYTQKDGIPSSIFNYAVQKDHNGVIWWGNEKGLLYVHPSQTMTKDITEKIEITGIYIGGKKMKANVQGFPFAPEYTSSIQLDPEQDNIGVRFSNLDYDNSLSGIFEYKLEGRDTIWYKLTGENQINFSGLDAGTYQLHIRKAGSLETVKTLQIIKKKSYALLIGLGIFLLVMALVAYLYKLQLLKLKRLKAMMLELASRNNDNAEKYRQSKLDDSESNTIKDALLSYMEIQEPFLNTKLKLSDVSAAIQYPPNKISQVLSTNLDTNFTDFINKYRVESFKKKTQVENLHQYTLSTLSEQCGFNSRSSFFNIFKKMTGQTPLEFLKQAGIVLDREK